MDWWKKEYSFESAYRNGTAAKDLWRYIPKRIRTGISDAFTDPDGYWIYLADGYTSRDGGEDCGVIHAYTIRDLKEDINTIRRL